MTDIDAPRITTQRFSEGVPIDPTHVEFCAPPICVSYAEKMAADLAGRMDIQIAIALTEQELKLAVSGLVKDLVIAHYKEAIETAVKAAAPQLKALMMGALKEKIEDVIDRTFPDDY